MGEAALGDDVLGDDPTAIELERLGAEMTGKEAGIWLPSGTMANSVAIGCQVNPGEALIADDGAHILQYEVGGAAALWGAMTWTVASEGGVPDADRIAARITEGNLHTPPTALICLENTHNRAGGRVLPLASLRAVRAVAEADGVPVHLDGARVMNAVAAGGGSLLDIAASVTTLTICLSKGLGAPAGTLLLGPSELIVRARRLRKRLGGGMRQIGSLCAAGIHGLTVNALRLGEDHARARRLAEGLAGMPGLAVSRPETNIIILDLESPAVEWVAAARDEGVLCLPFGARRVRLVTHHDVDDEGIERAISAIHRVAETFGSPRAAERILA